MPEILFNSDVPKIDERLQRSQPEFRRNFQSISDYVDANHVGFNNGAESGKHNFVQMIAVPGRIEPVVENVGILAPRNFGPIPGTVPVMVFGGNYPGALTSPITFGVNTNTTPPTQQGYIVIGNQVLIRWGDIALNSNPAGLVNINFRIIPGFPPFRAGSHPFVFLTYSLNPELVQEDEVPPLMMHWTGVSTDTSFQIAKVQTAANTFSSISLLAIGLL